MLAKETDEVFNDPGWIFEIKWDGFRAIAETGKEIRLYSRNGNSFANTYPVIIKALEKFRHQAILDGEICVLNEEGVPDFQKMQDYDNHRHLPLQYYAFDLLSLDGKSLYNIPLIERKKLLKKIIGKNPVIKYSEHIIKEGKPFYDAAVKQNLEGIMAKKADSAYYPGTRTTDWLKIKNHKTADVIISGYTEPTGSRQYFGSLVLGMMKNGKLVYAGNAGTGYNDKMLHTIYKMLQPLRQVSSPFAEKIKYMKATWVKPMMVCEVKFTEWTKDERLRHPVFLRIREDKSLKETDMKNQKPVKTKKTKESMSITTGKIRVPVSNPDKLYWPDEGITKRMVIDYYQEIAPFILPFLKDRPQSLKRNPNGIIDQGFFHKDAGEGAPSFVKSFPVYSESTKKEIDYIICNDKATLAYLNNLGCIELNPWHSTIKKTDHPDYMIIDIDPSEKNTFDQVIESAIAFKDLLDKAGSKCFCKTSGATGLHIYIPMGKKYEYEEVKNFAQLLCMIVTEELPAFTTVERNLKKRGNKKIYLDFLQNRKSQTISSVYSLRPKKGATVSMPLQWKEVKPGLTPQKFTIHNSVQRIKKDPEIFKGVLGPGINIPACLKKLGA
ncbi:MAG TPA: DNA ligase D [Ferruginibacter sp.]|nr:DNA ligase D [Ferruginibacter sp.]